MDLKRAAYFGRMVVVNFLAGAAVLVLVEFLVRLVYPDIGPSGTSYELMRDSVYGNSPGLCPGAIGESGGVTCSVDALGFWKYSVSSDTGRSAWLILGDSVTMGTGVEPDSTFVGRLVRAFNQERVLNASWIGYSSADYINVASVLLQQQARIRVHRITVFWTLNDIYSDLAIGSEPGDLVREIGGGILAYVRTSLRTYQWLRNLLFDRSRDYFQFDQQFYRSDGAHFLAAIEDLDSLQRMCKKLGVRFDLITLPYEFQLRDRSSFQPQALLKSRLDSLDVPCFDPAQFLLDSTHDPGSLFQFGDGIHFAPTGHKALSASLMSYFGEP